MGGSCQLDEGGSCQLDVGEVALGIRQLDRLEGLGGHQLGMSEARAQESLGEDSRLVEAQALLLKWCS